MVILNGVKQAGETSNVIQSEMISRSAETLSDMPQHKLAPV
jgi:hypothetical protein